MCSFFGVFGVFLIFVTNVTSEITVRKWTRDLTFDNLLSTQGSLTSWFPSRSKVGCSVNCKEHPTCSAFYYNNHRGECILYSSRDVTTHGAIPSPGSAFFKMIGSTDPPGPTDPDPTDPTDSTDSTYSTYSTDPTDPTDSTDLTYLVCPANPTSLPHVTSVQWTGRGDTWLTSTILTCDDDFITSQDDGIVSCTNDIWSGAECRRRVFHSPALDVTHEIPRPLVPGWRACMQGTPTQDIRVMECVFRYTDVLRNTNVKFKFSVFLMETPDTSWAYMDFRIDNAGYTNTAIFNTKDHPNGYVNEATFDLDPNPFSAGKEVNVTFTFVTETQLQVEAGELVMVYTYTRGLRDVTGVWISHDVDVTSFDLWC